MNVRERVRGIERQPAPERRSDPSQSQSPPNFASAISVQARRAWGRSPARDPPPGSDRERQIRLHQRVEAQEVIGAGERDVRERELRIALDGVLEMLDRRAPPALETRLPAMLATS